MNWSMHALFITRQKTQLADRKPPTVLSLYSVLTLPMINLQVVVVGDGFLLLVFADLTFM